MDNNKVGEAWVEFGGRTTRFMAALGSVRKATFAAGPAMGAAGLSVGTRFAQALAGPIRMAGKSAMGALAGIGKAAGAIGAAYPGIEAAGRGIMSLVTAGSDLNETLSAVDQVFGKGAGYVKAAADDMAKKFGIAKNEFLDGAMQIGALGQGFGQTEQQAARFGVTFAKLAADLASFRNISTEEALIAIRAGLSGESEPLKRFGVLVDEDRVKTAAWAMGLAKVGQELNQQQKGVARAALIQAGLAKASGDLARTQGGVANRMRRSVGSVQNAWAELGMAVQPAAVRVLEAIQTGLGGAISWANKHKDDLARWAGAAADALGAFASGVRDFVVPVGAAVGRFAGVIMDHFAKLGGMFSINLTSAAGWGQAVAGVLDTVSGWYEKFLAVGRSVLGTIKGWVLDNADTFREWGAAMKETFDGAIILFNDWKGVIGKGVLGIAGLFNKDLLDSVMFFARNWDVYLDDIGITLRQWRSDAGTVIDWLAGSLGKFGDWLGSNWLNLIKDAFAAALVAMTNMGKKAGEIGKQSLRGLAGGKVDWAKLRGSLGGADLLDGFKAKTAALPNFGGPNFDHSGFGKERETAWERAIKREEERDDRRRKEKSPEKGAMTTFGAAIAAGAANPAGDINQKVGGAAGSLLGSLFGADATDLKDKVRGAFDATLGAIDKAAEAAGVKGKGGMLGRMAGAGGLEVPEEKERKSEVLGVADLGKKVQEAAGKADESKKRTKLLEQIKEASQMQVTLAQRGRPATVG